MQASNILTNVAVLFLAVTVWDDMRKGGRVTAPRKTWLLVAALFAAISAVLEGFAH